MAVAGLMAVGALSSTASAATNSATAAPSAKVLTRTTMRSAPNPVTHAIDAVTVDEGPLVHTAQIFPWGAGGDMVGKDDVSAQVQQVMKNLVIAIQAAGGLESGIVKLNVYVSQADDLTKVRDLLARPGAKFSQAAASFVVTALPQPDALVAVDAVAITDANIQGVPRIRQPRLMGLKGTAAAILPAGGKYYISGQAKNGPLPEAVTNTLASIEKTLQFLNLDKSRVVQLKVFLQPISAADAVQAQIVEFFAPDAPPPTVFVEWTSSTNTPIEIETIAADNQPTATNINSVDFLTPPDLTISKVFSRVAHVNHGRMIYFSSFYGDSAGPVGKQLNDMYLYIDYLLPRMGTDFDHLVKATYYVTDDDASNKLNDIRPKFYSAQRPPAASKATVKGAGLPGRTVTVDLIGVTK